LPYSWTIWIRQAIEQVMLSEEELPFPDSGSNDRKAFLANHLPVFF
jgi:hypothetical protein